MNRRIDFIIFSLLTLSSVVIIPLIITTYILEPQITHNVNSSDSFLNNISLAIAGMSATAGSVVAIFIAFVSEQVGRTLGAELKHQIIFRNKWYRSRLKMMMLSCLISICALFANAVGIVLAEIFQVPSAQWTIILAVAVFTFGLSCFIFQLVAYAVQDVKGNRSLVR